MKTLLLDNYDSFTYNLFHDMAAVFGEAPRVVRNDEPFEPSALVGLNAIVISPGPGTPERPVDFGICRDVIAHSDLPLLGVCLGHQGLCHHYGARIERAPEPVHGRITPIEHTGTGLFAGLPSPLSVVRYHSLVAAALPDCLEVTARTPDGLVMAVSHRAKRQYGVQFHPESICTEHGRELLRNFAAIAEQARAERPSARIAWHARSAGSSKYPAPTASTGQPHKRQEGAMHLHRRAFPCAVDTMDLFARRYGASEHAFFLDSSLRGGSGGRYSMMGDASGPHARIVTADVQRGTVLIGAAGGFREESQTIFEYLKAELASMRLEGAALDLPFNLGFVGYLGYELKAQCGARAHHTSSEPDAALIFADRAIVIDHEESVAHALCLSESSDDTAAQHFFEDVQRSLESCTSFAPSETSKGAPLQATLNVSRREYERRVEVCQAAIAAGETYEVCLTQRIHGVGHIPPLEAYRRLRAHSPAPYASYLKVFDLSVLSSSPESFLQLSRDGQLQSKPIKGTRPRSADPTQDLRVATALLHDEKDRAENLMIVDLTRHDLGRCAELGSVTVPHLFKVESYAHVHQLVSTVRAQLRSGLCGLDAVQACFPGGSMTGAPKLRTLSIIDALEDDARGIYSGALGYFSLCGSMDLSMVIRTLVLRPLRFSLGTGGAIVALSDPQREFEEILVKARSVLGALQISLESEPEP